jgi:hypothetical protein
MKEQTLQELWALPTKMKPLPYDFYGHKLYSSDKLKLKFFESVLSTPWGKYHAKNFKRLLETNNIVPALMNKGILSFLSKKFLSTDWTKNIQGLYSKELQKVIIFIDNNSNWLGLSSNKTLVKTTLHECMHLSASDNIKGFLKIMQPTLQQYYGSYFSGIFSCKNLKMDKILKTLTPMEGRFSPQLQKNYMNALYNETKPKTSLDGQEYEDIFRDIYTITRSFPTSPNLLMRYYSKFYHIFNPFNTAYMKTFKERNSYTSPAQELWSLSEVAAVMVELLPVDKRVSQVLSNIK